MYNIKSILPLFKLFKIGYIKYIIYENSIAYILKINMLI